ncbi:MAG: sulfite oxidase-like oxidoreductase [Phycisphaerae bacterium]
MSAESEPASDVIISTDTLREQRVPPGQVLTKQWPVLHFGNVPKVDRASWRFELGGLVEQPWSCDLETIQRLPRVKVRCDIHCVTTWSRLDNLFEGPSVRTVLSHVTPKPEARYALIYAHGDPADRWTTNLPLADLMDEDCLFALTHDGEPLSDAHGGPVRLVVPRLYFWKSAKWVRGIEFRPTDAPGFWERNGYHMRGDPWSEERYGW